jgi:putative transposase
MPNFRRFYIPEALIFTTVVTHDRLPYLRSNENIDLLWETMKRVREIHAFKLMAYVILPDHFHWLMRVDEPQGNFSKVLHSIKRNFTLNYKKLHGIDSSLQIWQARFWDHVVRNEGDLAKHFDYIHWNPVKHEYVQDPVDWAYSSYAHWFEREYYTLEWGKGGQPKRIKGMNFE